MTLDRQSKAKIIILLMVCFLFALATAALLSGQMQVLNRSDFLPRWYAAQKFVAEGRSIYDPQNSLEVFSINHSPSELSVAGTIYPAHFFYPAHLMLLVLPFTWLSFPLAFFIWLVLVQIFLISGIYWLARIEGWPHSPNQLAVFLMLAIFFIPSIQNTIWGQFNTIPVISLVLVYVCLRRQRYVLAGICALGLTFKPQAMLLSLAFLLVWALAERSRWRFVLSFGLTSLGAWTLAEWIEPSWINGFLRGVDAYADIHHPQAMLAILGPAGNLLGFVLLALALAFFVWNRSSLPGSIPFAGALVLSLSVWWLVVSVLGMMNLVALPLALIWLFANLEKTYPGLYRFALLAFPVLYVLGLAGFLIGLVNPGLYGLHTTLSELAYKLAMPILTAVLAIPLCIAGNTRLNLKIFRYKEAS